MTPASILNTRQLGAPPWPTVDPFLFCVHHDDAYPRGNGRFGPAAPLAGRDIGQDFSRRDGWSMYHGESVPGFPAHPHRGFETVTIVRMGLVDHADSLGAAARYGQGDVQWLTTGCGVVHSEMFPLLQAERDNPLQLFQIWLNLPAASKMAAPHFTMFWADAIPRQSFKDEAGRSTDVVVIAGQLGGLTPLAPPPDSWAAHAEADIAIWTLRIEPGAHFTLPAARAGTRRMLYVYAGASLALDGHRLDGQAAVEVRADTALALANGDAPCEILVLQGRPIGEPMVQYGPFVMNTQAEIAQAFNDYRRTQFGGWPWSDKAPVHGAAPGRFARHPDGRTERPAAEPAL
ncbi:MAG: pirin family protein [Burkholderiales bacterium]|jgi:redox-sensitive bicupin YhaK (pirin superfamily)|nr:pirin family protein [Burkholderiales bacterium]